VTFIMLCGNFVCWPFAENIKLFFESSSAFNEKQRTDCSKSAITSAIDYSNRNRLVVMKNSYKRTDFSLP
jgi:hypothetical protein